MKADQNEQKYHPLLLHWDFIFLKMEEFLSTTPPIKFKVGQRLQMSNQVQCSWGLEPGTDFRDLWPLVSISSFSWPRVNGWLFLVFQFKHFSKKWVIFWPIICYNTCWLWKFWARMTKRVILSIINIKNKNKLRRFL